MPPRNQAEPLKRHETYFYDDGTVKIQIQTTLYQVHRFHFPKSSESVLPPYGSSEHFLNLTEVTPGEFEILLDLLYHHPLQVPEITPDILPAIFRVADLFRMKGFLQPLIEALERHSPDFGMFKLAFEYPNYFCGNFKRTAFVNVCVLGPLSVEEAEALDSRMVGCVAIARDGRMRITDGEAGDVAESEAEWAGVITPDLEKTLTGCTAEERRLITAFWGFSAQS